MTFIRVIIKESKSTILAERKTAEVSEDLTNALMITYKFKFLKFVETYLKTKYIKTKKDIYKEAQQQLKKRFSNILSYGKKYGLKSVVDMQEDFENIEQNTYPITERSIQDLIPHILIGNTALKAFKSAGMNEEEATSAMIRFFESRGLNQIEFNLEIHDYQKPDTYEGIFDPEQFNVLVTYDAKIFKKVLFRQKDIDDFLQMVQVGLDRTKRTIYHELQHLFVEIVKEVTGFKSYGVSPRSTTRGDIPTNDPYEIQTYAQNSVTFFKEMFETLKKDNKKIFSKIESPSIVSKILIKKILNSSLSPEEEQLLDSFDTKNITKYYDYIKQNLDKLKKHDKKVYNYALEILYSAADNI